MGSGGWEALIFVRFTRYIFLAVEGGSPATRARAVGFEASPCWLRFDFTSRVRLLRLEGVVPARVALMTLIETGEESAAEGDGRKSSQLILYMNRMYYS